MWLGVGWMGDTGGEVRRGRGGSRGVEAKSGDWVLLPSKELGNL
jgi:hypothetical protein